MKKIPTSVLVLSIIGLVFGLLNIVGVCGSALVTYTRIGPPNPVLDPLNADPIYKVTMGAFMVISLLGTIAGVTSNIACFWLARWARMAMIACAWLSIIQWVLGAVFNVAYVFPHMYRIANADGSAAANQAMMGGVIGGVCGICVGPVYPAFVLYYFTRQKVINAFNGIFEDTPAFPVQNPETPDTFA